MSYLNVAEVESALANLAAAHPGMAQLIKLPDQSIEQRHSHALCLGAGAPGSKPSILIIGGVHGREWGSCEIALNFATDLLSACKQRAGLRYGGKDFNLNQIEDLLAQRHIVVFPLVNPDGRHYSQTIDPMWRKNRRPAPAGVDPDCIGVDINRNFDFLFDFEQAFHPDSGVSASKRPCDNVYHGSGPFSEPESRNVRALLNQFSCTRWMIDLHSHSESVLHVWGDDEGQSSDATMRFDSPAFNRLRGLPGDSYGEFLPAPDLALMQGLAQTLVADLQSVRGKAYAPLSAFEYFPSSGTSHDYAYARHLVTPGLAKTCGFALEWGTEFQPPWAEMEEIIKDVSAGLIGFCLATV